MLKDKIIIITGGAGLIGRSFARAVLDNKGIAVIADIDRKKGTEVKDSLGKDFGMGRVEFVSLDITSRDSVNSMIDGVNAKFGKLDAVINNAYPKNKNYGKRFENISYADFCENVNLHLGGYFLVSQRAAEFFKLQGYGNIINMSSVYGIIPPRFDIYDGTDMTMPVEYSAIKSAVIHLTKYMAKYYKGYNIRFNCISPGGIFNDQPDKFLNSYNKYGLSKGMLGKEDLCGTLIFLLADGSKYINGQNIVVDDGWSL